MMAPDPTGGGTPVWHNVTDERARVEAMSAAGVSVACGPVLGQAPSTVHREQAGPPRWCL